MKFDKEQGIRVLKRCLKLLCPACGESSIVERPFHIRHHCPNCLSLYKREDGFFVGAILANVVITELVILVFCFFCRSEERRVGKECISWWYQYVLSKNGYWIFRCYV